MLKYFDNASTTYVYPEVIRAVTDCLETHWGNPANLYSFGLESDRLVEEARMRIASAINCLPHEIVFTSCASESNALALNTRTHAICTMMEHHDIRENPRVYIADEDFIYRMGQSDLERGLNITYENFIYSHIYVGNETGEIFDLTQKIKRAHDMGMLVHVDATQALGNIPIDVRQIDVDFMSFSFHKVHAPKGIGALYVRESVKDLVVPLIYGSQESNLRGGTSNVPYIVGAGIAIKRAIDEMPRKAEHCAKIKEEIISILSKSNIPFIINEGSEAIPAILNVAFKGVTGDAMMVNLDIKGFSVSTGSACNSGDHRPSEVLQAMGVPAEYINGAIRISSSLENSIEDARELANAIIESYNELTN